MHQLPKSIARHALFVLSMLTLSAATASAQSPRNRVAEISYRAPASCPNQRAFATRLEARLGTGSALPVSSLAIRLELGERSAIGEIRVVSGPRRGAVRRVQAANCSEAVDALALVTALLLEPEREGAYPKPSSEQTTRPDPETTKPPTSARESRSNRASANKPRDPGSAPSTTAPVRQPPPDGADGSPPSVEAPVEEASERSDEVAAEPPPELPNDRSAELTREAEPPPVSAPSERGPEVEVEGSQRSRPRRLPAFGLALSVLPAYGSLPRWSPGLLGRAAVSFPRGRPLRAALELSGRNFLPQRERYPQGDARYGLRSGALAVCVRGQLGRVVTSGCATAELGKLWAEGRNTMNPARAEVLFAALGPGARLAVRTFGPLSVHLGGELLVPLTRDAFELAGARLFRVRPLTIRLEVGVGLDFE
jgi:hypothetical protein